MQREGRPRFLYEEGEARLTRLFQGAQSGLVVRPAGHLFGQNTARVAFKRSAYLRNFVYTFAELLSSRLTRETVDRAMAGHLNDADL